MRRWWLFPSAVLVWIAAGFAIDGIRDNSKSGAAPPPRRIERIVSLAPNLTEILYALGMEEKVVGVTVHSDYPAAASVKPKVGTFWQPNIEAIIAVRPDLVFTLEFEQQRGIAERLGRMGLNCRTVRIETVSELLAAIETIGAGIQAPAAAGEMVGRIMGELARPDALGRNHRKPKVLWVVQREPLRVAGRDTFVNEMIELAGGENAIGPTVHKYPPLGAEQVIASAAEVIIEPTMSTSDSAAESDSARAYWKRFRSLPAVTNRRIHLIDADSVSRLGPRLGEAVELIAECLRPELPGGADD